MKKKIIIIGGVAGGATAATRLRRLNEDAQIILFERDEYISFANCGLPYYIGGVIPDRDDLLVQTAKEMLVRFKLDIRVFSEVLSVDRNNRTVRVRDRVKNTEYDETYDVLILSPGAKPIKPALPGIDAAENLFTLRNIADTDAIKAFVTEKKPKTAVVAGGGFIGLEMAENLCRLGIKVTIVEKLPQVIRPLDFEMAQFLHRELNRHGVDLILGDGIAAFQDKGRTVCLESGRMLSCNMAVLAIGVSPENTLAKSASLALGPKGHILTNHHFQTLDAETGKTVEEIYAIGDAIAVTDLIDGSKTAIPLAWHANRQAHIVADRISGRAATYKGALGTSVVKVFDLTAAAAGNSEAQLKAKNIPYLAIHVHRANHATYYPGAADISFKLLFSPTDGKILGAQAVGRAGTEKRMDVLSTVMKLGGSVYDLPDLEFCYAPPYSSAKDPVNILGYVAVNALAGDYKFAQYYEIDDVVKKGGLLLDVRTEYEFSAGHIEGARNVPLNQIRRRIHELNLPKEMPIYVYCQVGVRAHTALMILKGMGFTNLYNLSGGYVTYKIAKYKPSDNAN